jgi:hypothetical protein
MEEKDMKTKSAKLKEYYEHQNSYLRFLLGEEDRDEK